MPPPPFQPPSCQFSHGSLSLLYVAPGGHFFASLQAQFMTRGKAASNWSCSPSLLEWNRGLHNLYQHHPSGHSSCWHEYFNTGHPPQQEQFMDTWHSHHRPCPFSTQDQKNTPLPACRPREDPPPHFGGPQGHNHTCLTIRTILA